MKFIQIAALFASTLFFACQDIDKQKKIAYYESLLPKKVDDASDSRPKEQIYFLKKIKAESDYGITLMQ